MWYTLPARTPLYRASRANDTWDDVLQGYGSFFTSGGRYNVTHQQTVYATQDPLVALTEFGWHSALKRCEGLGDRVALAYPFAAAGKLWRFELATPITLVDVTHAGCVHQFGYPAHAVHNPHPDRYRVCQHVADQLRQWANPPAPNTRPEGLVAPSIRTPSRAGYIPRQVVLFVMPAPAVVPQSLQSRGTLLDSRDIELEFLTAVHNQPVAAVDPMIAWRSPRCRLSGSSNPVPRCPIRPRSRSVATSTWLPLDIQYSPH